MLRSLGVAACAVVLFSLLPGCGELSIKHTPLIEVTLSVSSGGENDRTWIIHDKKEIDQLLRRLPPMKCFTSTDLLDDKQQSLDRRINWYFGTLLIPYNIPSLFGKYIYVRKNIVILGDYMPDHPIGGIHKFSPDIHGFEAWLANKTMEQNLTGIDDAVKYYKVHNLLGECAKYTEPADDSWRGPIIKQTVIEEEELEIDTSAPSEQSVSLPAEQEWDDEEDSEFPEDEGEDEEF